MQDIEMIFVAYRGAERASEVLNFLNSLINENRLRLFNAAVIIKGVDGKTQIRELRDVDARRGALAGALFGGLIGLLGGPIGAAIGAATGSAAGGLVARQVDMGFSDKFLAEIKDVLKPASSALLLLVEAEWVEPLVEAMTPFQGKILRHTLRSDLVSQIILTQDEDD